MRNLISAKKHSKQRCLNMDESRINTNEIAQEFFDRFFAYDLLDRYPNHKIAAEAEYSLRLLWEAQKVCIQDWSFRGDRVREILYSDLTIEILLNAIGGYRIYCTAPWDLSIIIFAMLTICKHDPDLLEPTKMKELREQSMICFAGSGFTDYANAKNKADFFSYAKGKFFPLPQRIFTLGLFSGEILVYAYLLYREDRKTFKCHPSYDTIGKAVGMSKNTVKKYVDGLTEKRLIETCYTTVQTKDGRVHNGTLEYTILPLNMAEEYYDAKQMKRLVQEQARANIFKKLAKFDKRRERSKG